MILSGLVIIVVAAAIGFGLGNFIGDSFILLLSILTTIFDTTSFGQKSMEQDALIM
jgi:hypothetical protein